MYCKNCGSKIAEKDQFCPNCGKSTKKIVVEETVKEDIYSDKPKTSGLAIASLVIGIISIFLPVFGGILAFVGLILGICAKKCGVKVAGIVINAIVLVGSILILILLTVFVGTLASNLGDIVDGSSGIWNMIVGEAKLQEEYTCSSTSDFHDSKLEFEDGHFIFTVSEIKEEGTYSLDGSTITFTPEAGNEYTGSVTGSSFLRFRRNGTQYICTSIDGLDDSFVGTTAWKK